MVATAFVFDSLALTYDDWFDDAGKLIFAIEVQAISPILALLSKPWLEVGVGSGRFAQSLGIDIGLDPSIELLKMARKRDVGVFLGRGEETPLKDSVFGAVFLIATLCFVDSPLRVLAEVNRLLKEDGKIVLGLVERESPWGQLYQTKKGEGHNFYQYAAFYSFGQARALLEQAGFTIEEVLSTLFQRPGEVEALETPKSGFSPDAGFVVITGRKSSRRVEVQLLP